MGKLKYLMIHCSATPEGRDLKPQDIIDMHISPEKQADGRYKFMGKLYKHVHELPVKYQKKRGRGWSVPGYSEVITLDGKSHVLRAYNENNWVEANEVTNGATGFNQVTRHICYIGGLTTDGKKVKDTRTEDQEATMYDKVLSFIKSNPDIKILGHNQVANKGCPSFSVPQWLRSVGIDEENIYTEDPYKIAEKLEEDEN
jgi:N-acetylmuramoyl-L-alanine amidase